MFAAVAKFTPRLHFFWRLPVMLAGAANLPRINGMQNVKLEPFGALLAGGRIYSQYASPDKGNNLAGRSGER